MLHIVISLEMGITTCLICHFAYISLISGVKCYNNNIVFTVIIAIKHLLIYREIKKKYMRLKNIYRKKVNCFCIYGTNHPQVKQSTCVTSM